MELPSTLTLIIGSPPSLQMIGEGNLFPYVETTVTNGELNLSVASNTSLSPTRAMAFVLTAPSFRGITSASPGDIFAGELTATDMKLRSTSRGTIRLDRLDANTLDAQLDSSGELRIAAGEVGVQTISLRSTGSYVGNGLESAGAEVHLSSSGSAWVFATGRLTVTITGTGNVRYAGSPQVISNITGTGTVSPITE
jgi:hypothetical protein